MKTIGQLIKNARREKGLNRVQLAKKSGVRIRTLSALERGENKMCHKNTLDKILVALDMNIELIPIKEEPSRSKTG